MSETKSLPQDLIQEFTNMVVFPEPPEKVTSIYGTIVESNGQKFVRLDGTNMTTPVNEAVEIMDGDRVLVQITNREATAIGNITSPASARTAKNFMKLTNNGLMVGELDENGSPSGSYTLMNWSEFLICASNGAVLAKMDKDKISFAKKAEFGSDGAVLYDEDGNVSARFTKEEINFQNRAIFGKDGITFKNSSGAVIATFSYNSISLGGNDATIQFGDKAKFTPSLIELGEKDAEIRIGKDSSGNVLMSIGPNGLSMYGNNLNLQGRDMIGLWARQDNDNYVFFKMGFGDTGDIRKTPYLQVWGDYKGEQIWELILDQFGLTINTKYDTLPYVNGKALATQDWVNSKLFP